MNADARVTIRTMTLADIPFGMRLKEQAGWNQTEADWRRLMEYEPGSVFVAEIAGGNESAGTAAAVRYGTRFGWIGMVLVSPDFRRRGIATRLVDRCIEYLRDRGVETVKLDATPAGREVYLRLGFRDEWGLARFEGMAPAAWEKPDFGELSRAADRIEPMQEGDLEEVVAYDAPRFGADRSRVLAGFLKGWPEACYVLRPREPKGRGRIEGFVVARRGAHADQIGPCTASAPEDTRLLLEASIGTMGTMGAMAGKKVLMDVVTENPWARALVESLGFTEQRPFTRMTLGPNRFPGDFSGTLSVAGPELG